MWSPTAVGSINKIESVQRWFTKRIRALSNLSYDERLFKISNERLELCHLRTDLRMYYKIFHNFVDIHHKDFFTLNNAIKTQGNSLKILVPNSRATARTAFISLAHEIVNALALTAFLIN